MRPDVKAWRSSLAPALGFVQATTTGDTGALVSCLDLLAQDRLDPAVARLLPMATATLRSTAPDHPGFKTLEGMHRKAHFRNTLLLHRGGRLASLLQEAALAPVALKGAPLVQRYYPDLGSRPMSDVDLLLPAGATFPRVRDCAAQAGARAHSRQIHAWTFVDDYQLEYDVHRYLAPALAYPAAVDAVRLSEQTVAMGAADVLTLDAEGHVAHTLVHSTFWNTTTPVRWIADIASIQRQEPQLDWERVARTVALWGWVGGARRNLELLVAKGLVPSLAVAELDQVEQDGPLDRVVQALALADPRVRPTRHVAQRMLVMPTRLYARAGRGNVGRFYEGYLRDLWQVDRPDPLARALLARVHQRVRYGRELPVFADAEADGRDDG
jgi:hypothetical protein